MSFEFVNGATIEIDPPSPLPPIAMTPPNPDQAAITVTTSGGTPRGPASGVLAGSYPGPSFAVPMATQNYVITEVLTHVNDPEPHAVYDDMVPLTLYFENGLV